MRFDHAILTGSCTVCADSPCTYIFYTSSLLGAKGWFKAYYPTYLPAVNEFDEKCLLPNLVLKSSFEYSQNSCQIGIVGLVKNFMFVKMCLFPRWKIIENG